MARMSCVFWGGLSLGLLSLGGCTSTLEAPPRHQQPDHTSDAAEQGVDLDEGDAGGELSSPASLVLEPAQALVESAGVGQRAAVTIALAHAGGADVKLIEVSLREGAEDTLSELEVLGAVGGGLSSGERASLELSYIPLNTIEDSAALTWIIEDAQGQRHELVTRLTTRVRIDRELNYPELVDLGRVPAHTTARRLFPIYNNTDETVRLRDVYTAPASETISVAIADATRPEDASLDVGFDSDMTLEPHATALLAVTARPISNQPHQSALFFVSSLGTRQSVMRFNGGVSCFELEGATRSQEPEWDYRWEVGRVERGQQTRVIASLSSCSPTHTLKISAIEASLESAMRLDMMGWAYPLSLAPLQSQDLMLEVDGGLGPQAELFGGLVVRSDDQAQPEVRVQIVATVGVECPVVTALGSSPGQPVASASVEALVGERVLLEGGAQPEAVGYQWSFARTPVNSTASFMPDGLSQQTAFVPDLPGVYTIELETADESGVTSCQPVKVQVRVR